MPDGFSGITTQIISYQICKTEFIAFTPKDYLKYYHEVIGLAFVLGV
jgi:hypothetical protein